MSMVESNLNTGTTDPLHKMRSRSYKAGIDSCAGRRRREEGRIQIRKKKRMNMIHKRRAILSSSGESVITTCTVNVNGSSSGSGSSTHHLSGPSEILSLLENAGKNIPGGKNLLELLTSRNDESVSNVSMSTDQVPTKEFIMSVVQCGIIPQLVAYLEAENPVVREQSALFLGNIAGEDAALRNQVLDCNAMRPLLLNISNPPPNHKTFLDNAVWALSNFCRGSPKPSLSKVGMAIPYLHKLLQVSQGDTLVAASWTLAYMSEGGQDVIDALVTDVGAIQMFVRSLSHENIKIITAMIRIIDNIFVDGSMDQARSAISSGVLKQVTHLLRNSSRSLRKELCWLLSSVTGERERASVNGQHEELISHFMQEPYMIESMLELISNSESDVRREASWVILNVAHFGSDKDVERLVEAGAIKPLCDLIAISDVKVTLELIKVFDGMLMVGDKIGKDYVRLFYECGGIEKIEELQQHKNDDVYGETVMFLEKFFSTESYGEEDGDEYDENYW